ncbi:MAG: aldehyde ferredoxin oxidoreductase N-terminal domain-containing protein, partial [Promethearchaeota archaeon]
MPKKILRVNMTNLETKYEDVPEAYAVAGGRGLTSAIVAAEVPPDCHPLGPSAKVVFAPGLVTGTRAPSCGRISVGGKSPLTGGIKEANAGTNFAHSIAKLRIAAIIVEGQAKKDDYYLLKINKDGAELISANKYAGKGLYDTFKKIRGEFGDKVNISGVGIAAEMGGAMSGISFSDPEGMPSRYAGRGGLGAVMASRGLKFIVADDTDAPGVEIANEQVFSAGVKKLVNALASHDVTKPGGGLPSYGTDVLVNIINEVGGLPQRNFSAGSDDRAANLSGETKAENIKVRGG